MKDVLLLMLACFVLIFFSVLLSVTAFRLALIVSNNIVGVFG